MGLSSLTRYNLFMESGDSIESDDGIVRFRDYLSVKNMYYDSARLIRGFEDIINNEERMPQMEEYQGIFDRNANEVQDLLFLKTITNQINQQISKKMEKAKTYSKKYSNQFLFLRTTNSELRIRGNNNSIRQWCAWEIGNFYTKHKEEKYYTSFYDKTEPRNDILDTFRPMREVVLGEIR